jgi:hypothetical protein
MALADHLCSVVKAFLTTQHFANGENNNAFTNDITSMERANKCARKLAAFFTRMLDGAKLHSHFNGFAIKRAK